MHCQNSVVFYNEITDATDGGIVIFQAPGSDVHDNRITATYNTLINGISMSDYDEYAGNYSGTTVHDNIINAQSAYIKAGIGIGPQIGSGCSYSVNYGGSVTNNLIEGPHMGYGVVVGGVTGWTLSGNTYSASYAGNPVAHCDNPSLNPSPGKCYLANTSGSFADPCTTVSSLQNAVSINP